jgi:diguanylate cyclase (GGDEF)-like protein
MTGADLRSERAEGAVDLSSGPADGPSTSPLKRLRDARRGLFDVIARLVSRTANAEAIEDSPLHGVRQDLMLLLARLDDVIGEVETVSRSTERDRERAAMVLQEATLERDTMRFDDVTGALQRRHGLDSVRREIDRVRRGDGLMVIGFVDVDGLKALNDEQGHAAGDQLLRATVRAIKDSLRSYDAVVRVGGDEFVYSLAGTTLVTARERAVEIQAALGADTGGHSASIGLAALRSDDTLSTVVARADNDLYAQRRVNALGLREST